MKIVKKSHLLLSTGALLVAYINGKIIKIQILRYQISFDEHVPQLCDKTSQKLCVMVRIPSSRTEETNNENFYRLTV